MSTPDIRKKALDLATSPSLTYGTPPPSTAAILATARAFEAYLAGPKTDGAAGEVDDSTSSRWAEASEAAPSQTDTGAAQDTAPVSPWRCTATWTNTSPGDTDHRCARDAGHDGPHRCSVCSVEEPVAAAAPSLPDEPPVGSIVVLRSPTTGALLSAVRQSRGFREWFDFIHERVEPWEGLTEGREVVAVHTPDVTS